MSKCFRHHLTCLLETRLLNCERFDADGVFSFEWSQKRTVSQFYETWHQCLSHNKSGPTANACFRQTNEPRAKTRNIFYTIYSRHRWLNIFSQLLSRLIVTNCGSWQFKIKNQPGKQAKWASLATISLDWAILILLVL